MKGTKVRSGKSLRSRKSPKKKLKKVLGGVAFAASLFLSAFVLLEFHGVYWLVAIVCLAMMGAAYFFLGEIFADKDQEVDDLLAAQQALDAARDNDHREAEDDFKRRIEEQVTILNKTNKAMFMAMKTQAEAQEAALDKIQADLSGQLEKVIEAQNTGVKTIIKFNKENAKQASLSEKEALESIDESLKAGFGNQDARDKERKAQLSEILQATKNGVVANVQATPVQTAPVQSVPVQAAPAQAVVEPEVPVADVEMPDVEVADIAISDIDIPEVETTEESLEEKELEVEFAAGEEVVEEAAEETTEEATEEVPEFVPDLEIPVEEVPEEVVEEMASEESTEEVAEFVPDIEIPVDESTEEAIPEVMVEEPSAEEIPAEEAVAEAPAEEVPAEEVPAEEAPAPSLDDALASTGVDLSDPNAALSPDDIAALFAAAGGEASSTVEINEDAASIDMAVEAPAEEAPVEETVAEEPAETAPVEETVAEEAPAPSLDDALASTGVDLSDPNAALSADDIAALFAAAGGAAAPAEEPAAEPEKSLDEALASTGVDLSDPNAALSADDIAALFAAAGN